MDRPLGANPTDAPGAAEPIRSISRAFQLLELFDHDHPQRHVRDLARLTGIPRTTVLRVLATLEGLGLVAQIAESTYQVGPGALRWFRLVQQSWTLPEEVHDELRSLRDETGESINIYVRQGAHRVSIGQAEGSRTVRSVVRIGVPLDLAAGSSGTVLLAHAPDSVTAGVQVRAADPTALAAKLEAFRENGYAVSHGERESGASSLSLPLRCPNGAVAALSISGPTSRFNDATVRSYLETARSSAWTIEELGLGPVEALIAP